jgi:uncharacterized OB-fold protein
MTGMNDRPTPVVDDPDTGGFFQAAARGALAVQFCTVCGTALHLPKPCCSSCRSPEVEWRDVPPRGRVYSWTVVEQQTHPAFPVPYTIVLVELDHPPGVRLVGHLPGRPALGIDDPVRADFGHQSDDRPIPQWTLAP